MKILSVLALFGRLSFAQFSFGSRADLLEQVPPRPCFVPTGKGSFCVPLSQCPYVSDLVKNLKKPIAKDVALVINDSFFCPKQSSRDPIEICCPFDGIEPPLDEKPGFPDKNECLTQTGKQASCALYNDCSPFLQLLLGLQKPIPPTLPKLMRGSWLCGFENVAGFNLPKICCPDEAIIKRDNNPSTTTSTTTTTTTTVSPFPLEPPEFANHANRRLLANLSICGAQGINAKIVNGEEANIGEFPWLANLGYAVSGRSNIDFKCGGALIGDRYVISAAHCVTQLPGSFQLKRIRLGEHRLSTDPDCSEDFCNEQPQDFDIEEIIFHQDYGVPQPFRNDIALIRLSRPANISEFVRPICLPFDHEESENYAVTSIGQDVAVAGWGATNERGRDPADALQKLFVPVFEGDQCNDVYKNRGGVIDSQSQMCAGGEAGKDSCVGDSGSALMREEKVPNVRTRRWKLLGIVSFGPRLCGTQGVPGVYTRVRHYLPWILDHIRS